MQNLLLREIMSRIFFLGAKYLYYLQNLWFHLTIIFVRIASSFMTKRVVKFSWLLNSSDIW